ncbi:butyrophilin subfamily 3 member A3-like isoform X1 [Amia ocellicauda]|uniref:butyrophilin subfamily 3 member A3-like isoform X1 n=1 Tax=Amia ocellicauda TaxID=2972642 RepID=UPI003464A839
MGIFIRGLALLIGLLCSPSGGQEEEKSEYTILLYPEPQMFWTDKIGANVSANRELPKQQSRDSTYSIASHILVSRARSEGLHCVVKQQEQEQHFECGIKINDQFFESTHPVTMYVSVVVISIVLGLVCILAAGIYVWDQKRDQRQKLKEYKHLMKWLQSLEKVNEDQKRLLDAVRYTPSSVWNWICDSAVDVTLDPETAQDSLSVSEDGKTVTLGESQSV